MNDRHDNIAGKRRCRILMVDALVGNDYSILLCNQLHLMGVDITLATTVDREIKIPVSFPVMRWIPSKNPKKARTGKALEYVRYVMRLVFLSVSRQFDVIHFQFFRFERMEAFLMLLMRIAGIRMIHTAHNVFPHEKRTGDRTIKTIIYRASWGIIVHSETVRKRLSRIFAFAGEKTAVIPHGNFEVGSPGDAISREAARKRLHLGDKEHLLLFFGYIRKYKGLDRLLPAFEIAFGQNRMLRLLIAGQCQTRQMENQLKEQIRVMNSQSGIIFAPGFATHEKMAEYFVAADWVMLPYRRIDHSGIIHLAYAYGRAVIVADIRGLADMVKEEQTGFVADTENSETFAKTILRAASDRRTAEQMGNRGKYWGEMKYNWSHAANLTRQMYEEAGPKRRPS
jgi:D-inositol-3-phosphate glycosyltransferase